MALVQRGISLGSHQKKPSMRRKITTILTSLAMLLLGTIAIAPPANAASGGSFCFKEEDDEPFAYKPVYIDLSTDGKFWYNVLATQTDWSGCGGFTLSGGYTGYLVRAQAQWDLRGPEGQVLQRWGAYSPLWGLPGDEFYSLGTGIVLCASWEPYAPCR